jgi:TolA-binding protein
VAGVVGLAAAVGLGSCAYYNIYWMASHEYEKATTAVGAAEFWDPFAQKPLTGEAIKNIDSCAKRCGKILLLYPKSKWVDDALVLMGNCFTLKGEYATALRKYEELLKFYPSSELVDEALYMEAYTHVLDGSTGEALASLEAMEDQIKTKRWREHVVYLAGKIYRKNADCDGAIEYYEKYLKSFPEGQRAVDVTLALADCLIKVGRQSEAAELLEPLTKKQDLTGSVAAIKLGAAYRKLGQDDKALGIFRGLADKTLADSVRARADIETAITLEGQGKPEEAVGVLGVADSLGKSALGGEARYRIGLIYEQRLSDFAKAAAAYDEAGKSATEYGRLAAKRASALKSVAKYEQVLSDSTVKDADKLAMNRFLLAETYLIDLGLAVRAETELRVLSDSLAANPFTARSKLALGSLLEARGDTTARAYYRAVIDSFPTTVYANMARSRLSLPLVDVPIPVTPAPAADTASATQPGPPPTFIGPTVPADTSFTRRPSPAWRPAEDSLRIGPPADMGPAFEDSLRIGPPAPPDTTGGRGSHVGDER